LEKRLEGLAVAKVIEFYIPATFSKRVKWLPPQERGKVLEFRLPATKSAWSRSDDWFHEAATESWTPKTRRMEPTIGL